MGAHSDLGPSAAERWLECPGSIALLQQMRSGNPELLPTDEEDYQREGTALHSCVETLYKEGRDAWELIGETVNGVEITREHADAIDTCLETMRPLVVPHAKVYSEYRISAPELHPDAFGTLDFGCVADSLLNIVDCKFGMGVVVEVERNPQLMYYAYGLLRLHPKVKRVVIRIVQPRAYHPDGSVRRWETTADDIRDWALDTLGPAMHRAMRGEGGLVAGSHCRFCPAKLVCPLLSGMFEAACHGDTGRLVSADSAVLAQNWIAAKAVRNYLTALEKEVFKRLMAGQDIEGVKLVPKRANRVWKPGGQEAVEHRLGELAWSREFRSPADIEKIGGKDLVAQWAYTPENGLTVAAADDPKPGVKIQKGSEVFKGYLSHE